MTDRNAYQREKYRTDPVYRQNQIDSSSRWQQRNKKKRNAYSRKKYAQRTPQQIRERKKYLKKLRSRKKR